MAVEKEGLIYFGGSSKPHGLKGAFEFHLDPQADDILDEGLEVRLFPRSSKSVLPSEGQVFEIDRLIFGHKIMLSLKGISNRESGESLLPFDLYVQRSHFPELAEGEFYWSDLLGLEVVDPDTGSYGVIKEFYFNGAQQVAVIRLKTGGQLDIPFVEPFLGAIELEKRQITLKKVEYVE